VFWTIKYCKAKSVVLPAQARGRQFTTTPFPDQPCWGHRRAQASLKLFHYFRQ